jgi:hypothetical protein
MKEQMNLELITHKYPSDKCKEWGHNYIPGYEDLLKDIRFSAKTVLEIGIGCGPHERAMQRGCPTYKSGNSIRMWRDYFTNAKTYAVDIMPEGMIHGEERIQTYVVDQGSEKDLLDLTQKVGGKYDFICDDGSHMAQHQVFSFMVLEKFVNPGGIYVIEDVQPEYIDRFKDLSIFGKELADHIRTNYKIVTYDTRKEKNIQDDFLMCFVKNIPPKPQSDIFVILRCIRTEEDKKLWRRCYVSIRYFYQTTKIIIIDDNSLLADEFDQRLEDTTIIKSDFTGSAEVLPFYYFLKYHWADRMIVMHDSMFFKRPFTAEELAGKVKFLWHFDRHEYDNNTKIDEIIQFIPHSSELISLRKSTSEWNGCFGLAMIIDWSVIKELDDKYGIVSLLIHFIKNREERMAYERVFGLVVFKEQLVTKTNCSMFGSIHDYVGSWQADFEWQMKNQHLYPYAIMKTWSGR